jgi:hypothetical protein
MRRASSRDELTWLVLILEQGAEPEIEFFEDERDAKDFARDAEQHMDSGMEVYVSQLRWVGN